MNINDYIDSRIATIQASIAAEELANNIHKLACEKTALAELEAMRREFSRAVPEANAHSVLDGGGLKPCPFCGGKAEYINIKVNNEKAKVVQCVQCRVHSPSFCLNEDAIEAWNNRAAVD